MMMMMMIFTITLATERRTGGSCGGRPSDRCRVRLRRRQVQEGCHRGGLFRHHLQRSRGDGRPRRKTRRTEAHVQSRESYFFLIILL